MKELMFHKLGWYINRLYQRVNFGIGKLHTSLVAYAQNFMTLRFIYWRPESRVKNKVLRTWHEILFSYTDQEKRMRLLPIYYKISPHRNNVRGFSYKRSCWVFKNVYIIFYIQVWIIYFIFSGWNYSLSFLFHIFCLTFCSFNFLSEEEKQ